MNSIEINPRIKLLAIALEGQEVGSRRLIDINLLDEGLEPTIVGLNRDITLFAREKRLKDLHNAIDVHLVGIHNLHSESQEMGRGDAR
ncbi:unnamed protein product [Spirodela intermedia]|uniref:Uncharacterized protein n=2 Tax=Spirodela intermedia TaxID=51605 RepID=A0A7I8K8T1_SPIIN|nr:unnamed protein product [Spirodela intermedia]CAA6657197.1 unnamed protein product [Spirodela intermedia]CAA7393216.1 unnamed protein product [Spirodela intermedia]